MRLVKSLLLSGILGITSVAAYSNSNVGEGSTSAISGKSSSEIVDASRNSTTRTTTTTTRTTTTTTRGHAIEEEVAP